MLLQQDEPDDYVFATGETTTVRRFVEWAFAETGISINWKGEGVDEKGYDIKSGECLVELDPRCFWRTEVKLLLGDPTKGANEIGLETRNECAGALC
jgi:GDPmannose 4,6-dehydratase